MSKTQSGQSRSSTYDTIRAIKKNPAKRDECQHQLDNYNPSSANNFDILMRYIETTMNITPLHLSLHLGNVMHKEYPEIAKTLNLSVREVGNWKSPESHPPNSLVRKEVQLYALKLLKNG